MAVLIQNSRGGGLATNISSVAQASQIVGDVKATDLIEKITWGLAASLVIFTFAANYFYSSGTTTVQTKSKMGDLINNTAAPTTLPNVDELKQKQENTKKAEEKK
jgi:preprotein translocase subunit SecG